MTSWNGNIFRVTGLFVRGIHLSPVNFPHKGRRRGASVFSLICAWTNGWINNWNAGDLRCTHYDVTVLLRHHISSSEIRRYICNIFFHWPGSTIGRKRAQVIKMVSINGSFSSLGIHFSCLCYQCWGMVIMDMFYFSSNNPACYLLTSKSFETRKANRRLCRRTLCPVSKHHHNVIKTLKEIFSVLVALREYPSQRPITQSFGVFFHLHL